MSRAADWFQSVLSPDQFIPHGHCYLWQTNLVWLHVLSDGLIAISYFSIPIMLFYFVQKRKHIVFRNIFLLFGLFIITCGTTHLFSILTLWYPAYWLSGTVKAITAVASSYAALALLPVIPVALALPSPEKLKQINEQLEKEIGERRQAEADLQRLNRELESRTASLRKSEQRFRSLFESAPDFIYVLNERGIIQQVNSTVISRSGYCKAELIGQPLVAFLSEETQRGCQATYLQLLPESRHHQEVEFVCKDGQVLSMDCACTVVKDQASGEALADTVVLVLQRDVTQRNQAEKERTELLTTLKESERRWQSFLQNVRLMVVGLNQLGEVEYVNPYFADLLDYSPAKAIGQSWVKTFVPELERDQAPAIFQDMLNHKNRPNYQSSLVTRSGETRVISWNTVLLQDTQGAPSGTLSIGEDITERDAVDRMKNEFISVVSHELRTPLTAVHGALDLLSSGLIDPISKQGQYVFAIAVENSDRLVKLVNDILELERLESGKIRLHRASVSTRELTRRTFEMMALSAERSQVQLEVMDANLLLWADGDRIIQVLTNLVDNAIKFSDTPAKVWVMVTAVGKGEHKAALFTVKDEGRGIPSDKLENIFERFHQVDASDSRQKGGTGLGLAICRSIVQQHGGDISVESTLDEGSCFRFRIPIE